MKYILSLIIFISLAEAISAQYVYTIKADSVKLTSCDSSELIVENHTQNVAGFLFNTGNGRTVFKKGVLKINDSFYLIGADTLKVPSTAWLQGGNRFGTTGVLGTLDSNHLDFYTNGAQRLRLTNTGNFLLGGATDNGVKFQMNGDAQVNLLGESQFFTIKSAGRNSSNGGIKYNITDSDGVSNSMGFTLGGTNYNGATNHVLSFNIFNTDYMAFSGSRCVFTEQATLQGGFIGAYSTDIPIILQVNGTNPTPTGIRFYANNYAGGAIMSIMQDGNVGIGTTAPTAQFHTTGTVCLAGLTSDTSKTRVLVSDANGNLYYRDAATLAANGILKTDLANRNAILNSSLAINGNISAQRLKLSQAGWPDYVFDSSYRLPNLKETKEYIRRNGHLPGIPSAKEVESKGIDVGDHQAALLKKIEELTLYVITQEEKLKTQQDQIDALQEQNKDLKSLKQEMAELKKMISK